MRGLCYLLCNKLSRDFARALSDFLQFDLPSVLCSFYPTIIIFLDVRKGIEFACFLHHNFQVVLEGEGGDVWEGGVEGEQMDAGMETNPPPDWTDSPSHAGKPAADLV